jgi:hypothetical protein
VVAGDSDAAGDVAGDGDGVTLGSTATALHHAKQTNAHKNRVAFIFHNGIDTLRGNAQRPTLNHPS